MILALTLLLLGADDPRPELVELQLAGRHDAALARVEEFLAESPATAAPWGLEYLRGHLLELLEKGHEAPGAFAAAMTSAPLLAGYSRYRLAVNQYRSGHPEVAAGLIATLLANQPPEPLIPVAVRLLTSALARGGDCRLLQGVDDWNLPAAERRPLELSLADCMLAAGDRQGAGDRLIGLLREHREDETARGAAERLARLIAPPQPPEASLLLGLTFYHHREFRPALSYLEPALRSAAETAANLPGVDRGDVVYALARSLFWLGEYAAAAARFGQLADQESDPEKVARARYQRARSLELHGDWSRAAEEYLRAFEADRSSDWAPAALLSTIRLEWRRGHEEAALKLLRVLESRREWRFLATRAALFAAASDIVRGRSDRAGAWLGGARRARAVDSVEIEYWQGRLAELQGQITGAVRSYATLLGRDSYHPLALAARGRLERPELADAARAEAERLASSARSQDLLAAWLLLGEADPRSGAVRARLVQRLERSARTRTYLELRSAAPPDWSIWHEQPRRAEELLLSLGIVEQMSPVVRSRFPLADVSLAVTSSRLLEAAGLYRDSLHQAEVVSKGLPAGVPPQLLPRDFRHLLYPRPFDDLVQREASRFGVDRHLLTAIIREESRFDSMAISSASARGLTQFVLPTARRLAEKLGWQELRPADLHQPEVSITLGAAYLAELAQRFDGQNHVVIAAYNAGDDQARLWLSYCYSREPEEFFSKVGFRQTKAYLHKVTSSWAQYQEIYGTSAAKTTGGRDW